jgi:hypothetical protein
MWVAEFPHSLPKLDVPCCGFIVAVLCRGCPGKGNVELSFFPSPQAGFCISSIACKVPEVPKQVGQPSQDSTKDKNYI